MMPFEKAVKCVCYSMGLCRSCVNMGIKWHKEDFRLLVLSQLMECAKGDQLMVVSCS